jgi:hypothetical protein
VTRAGQQRKACATRAWVRLTTAVALFFGMSVTPFQAQTNNDPTLFEDPPIAPSLNFYGVPGLMDMPTGEALPDAQFATGLSYFGGNGRFNLTFQALPWLSATFRYNMIQNWNLAGFTTYYDRGFDVRFRLFKERRRFPAVTLGLQDFAGTGIYGAEYIVATKGFDVPGTRVGQTGRVKVTGGLGWGRFGSRGSIASFGERPAFDPTNTGGQLSTGQWFRGDVSPFFGLEYLPSERWGIKLEYSTDRYVTETEQTSVFDWQIPVNAGVEYQWTPRTRVGLYYMYGSEVGFNAQFSLNPLYPAQKLQVPAPRTIQPRPSRSSNPGAWSTDWAASTTAAVSLRDQIAPILRQDGLILESLTVTADAAELRFRNQRFTAMTAAIGRAARAMAAVLPASVETFRLVPVVNGMGLSATVIRRSDLEALQFDDSPAEALEPLVGFTDAAGVLDGQKAAAADLYPDFGWAISPYFLPSYFDPDQPIRLDFGIEAIATYEPAPGWQLAGQVRARVAGNVADGRVSESQLPPVRTQGALYFQEDVTLTRLYAARYWRAGENLYARATTGIFEQMYGGVSGEVLWQPVSSRLGLGIEANWVKQRDFDQRLTFQDYSVFTGHASAYYRFGNGFDGKVDVGRYLAGDIGATFSLARTFSNGWSFGGFFTLTDVSAEEFGEGSFDKGIALRIPLSSFTGQPSRKGFGSVIRPIQRDGGARVFVPGRLYPRVIQGQTEALTDAFPRIWE